MPRRRCPANDAPTGPAHRSTACPVNAAPRTRRRQRRRHAHPRHLPHPYRHSPESKTSARGKGIAFELTDAAVELARKAGARTIDLTSRPSRASANRLYQRGAFTPETPSPTAEHSRP
ncbi:GNAT family N-acetyltransferase [Nocardia aobensis]|uniref:GNAT family N-acetyltransferase n=1 Tax=Nocardia aobensis TaxID=257277 RepID=A0ABW6PA29_9NOCA